METKSKRKNAGLYNIEPRDNVPRVSFSFRSRGDTINNPRLPRNAEIWKVKQCQLIIRFVYGPVVLVNIGGASSSRENADFDGMAVRQINTTHYVYYYIHVGVGLYN